MATSKNTNRHDHVPTGYYQQAIKKNPFQAFWHQTRFREIGKIIEPLTGEILDIGACDGTFSQVILKKAKAKSLVGIDIVSSLVKFAKKRFKRDKRFKFLVADAEKLPFKNDRFGAVFCLEALEHVDYPEKVIEEAMRVTKPGGYVVILVPTDSYLFNFLWWIVLHTWGKHWQETHVNSFRQAGSLGKLLESAGYRVEIDKKFLWNMLEVVRARK
ncbi:MAG: class I SAM-dependent methyltransferase [Candidatus Shapirobacteria bacterium]|jgi:ubiquinone/menaquinone biosynthesis C-methylase UbiE